MRNINVFAKKMARNGLKIANSLGCAFRFESDFTYVIIRGLFIRELVSNYYTKHQAYIAHTCGKKAKILPQVMLF